MNIHRGLVCKSIVILLVGLGSHLYSQQHFNPVTNTGNSCAIVIMNAIVDGIILETGDEIGVYDGDLCVGVAIIQSTFPVNCAGILEFQGPGGVVLIGAKVGQPIEFRVWDKSRGLELLGAPSYTSGGHFGNILTIVGHVSASTSSPVTEQADITIPDDFSLSQNFPNPFNPSTTIRYHLPGTGRTRITIFDILGQKMRSLVDEMKTAGKYTIVWDARDDRGNRVSAGAYFIRIEAGNDTKTRKMLLVY